MFLRINPENPAGRKISQVVDCLEDGGVIIYPTDSVYAFGFSMNHRKAMERVCRLREIHPKQARFSLICHDISQVSQFTMPLHNETFKLMKRNLPGPFTFVLQANNNLGKQLKSKQKELGIRIPSHPISQAIIKGLGLPMFSASLYSDDEILRYESDPSLIYDEYGKQVDIVIDGGPGGLTPSTVVDCTGDAPEIIRPGVGELRF